MGIRFQTASQKHGSKRGTGVSADCCRGPQWRTVPERGAGVSGGQGRVGPWPRWAEGPPARPARCCHRGSHEWPTHHPVPTQAHTVAISRPWADFRFPKWKPHCRRTRREQKKAQKLAPKEENKCGGDWRGKQGAKVILGVRKDLKMIPVLGGRLERGMGQPVTTGISDPKA